MIFVDGKRIIVETFIFIVVRSQSSLNETKKTSSTFENIKKITYSFSAKVTDVFEIKIRTQVGRTFGWNRLNRRTFSVQKI